MTTITINTWHCEDCGYSQDFEPTQENINKFINFNSAHPVNELVEGECLCCFQEGTSREIIEDEGQLPRVQVVRSLVLAPADKSMQVNVDDEEKFDDDTLVRVGDSLFVTTEEADRMENDHLERHLLNLNKKVAVERLAKGEEHVPITKDDDHGFVPERRHQVTKKEREAMKQKIRDDIARFKAIERK